MILEAFCRKLGQNQVGDLHVSFAVASIDEIIEESFYPEKGSKETCESAGITCHRCPTGQVVIALLRLSFVHVKPIDAST